MWRVMQDWKQGNIQWAVGHGDDDLHDIAQYLTDSILPGYLPSFTIVWDDGTEMSLEDYCKANDIQKRSF